MGGGGGGGGTGCFCLFVCLVLHSIGFIAKVRTRTMGQDTRDLG